MKKLVAVINGESQIEYDRTKTLPQKQQDYIQMMDDKMDQGIPHGTGHIFAPAAEQKAQFVASQLMQAIKSDNEQLIAATMAYLALKLPELQQVIGREEDGEMKIQFVYDRPYVDPKPVQFVPIDKLNS